MPFQGPSAGDVAEGVTVEAGLPLTGQGEVGGQIADGVGGLGATTVAAQGDDEVPRFEDVDVRVAMGGVGVGAAPGVPGADAEIRQQVGQGLAQGGQRPVIVAAVVPGAYGGGIRQPVVDHHSLTPGGGQPDALR